ncbi:hypothetical protein HPB48_013152 [Haemaphysalis longicornis]|uniref:Uncharacterized protein n=1 Tax=Haemaphysalis longicornis TaxID=44386 RepID=A0A9J6GLT1_HAELO|nr:hypothetical protein HPB48_013152 [Haemaphysalis longicornis]
MNTAKEGPGDLDLACIKHCTSTLTGAALRCPEECTASDSGPCHIFADIEVWNEYLSLIQFELREEAPGRLHLVSFGPENLETSTLEQIHRAFTLAFILLKNHTCVVAFHMGFWSINSRHRKLISRGIQGSSALKSINVGRNKWLMDDILTSESSLTVLEELRCYALDRPRGFFRPLCSFLAKSTSIKTLDVMNVAVDAF